MCVIVSKPGKVKITRETLQNCWDNNPDGAGFMYPKNGKVFIRKGFMSFKSFWNEAKDIPMGVPVVYHFRIKTHGATCKELCHPYPISYDYDQLHASTIYSDYGVAHNGIFGNLPNVDEESDTTIFIANVLTPILKLSQAEKISLTEDYYEDLLDFISGSSRLAIMDSDGQVKLSGSGWISDKGCRFSNTGYTAYNYYCWNGDESYKPVQQVKIKCRELLKGSTIYRPYQEKYVEVEKDADYFLGENDKIYTKATYSSDRYYDIYATKGDCILGKEIEIMVTKW